MATPNKNLTDRYGLVPGDGARLAEAMIADVCRVFDGEPEGSTDREDAKRWLDSKLYRQALELLAPDPSLRRRADEAIRAKSKTPGRNRTEFSARLARRVFSRLPETIATASDDVGAADPEESYRSTRNGYSERQRCLGLGGGFDDEDQATAA